ncbi:hypothetical protein LJC46_03645, partial [Desulfovibrio sp. OttesenSCG-928-G15]|nr:hypothetical protein [Desulfovibrio sp. OttesenSCG-928-G15]
AQTENVEQAPEPDPSPLLYGESWDAQHGGMIVGGFDSEAAVDIFFTPIQVGDGLLRDGEAGCPQVEEGTKARTKLLPSGTQLRYFTVNGEQIATATSAEIGFLCLEASGQVLLNPELTNVRAAQDGYTGPFLGMRSDVQFAGVPTKRAKNKDGSLSFTPARDDTSIVFHKVHEDDKDLLSGILRLSDEEREIFRIPFIAEDKMKAAFIDLNADGALEFLLVTEGPAGVVAVFDAAVIGESNLLFLVDLGE